MSHLHVLSVRVEELLEVASNCATRFFRLKHEHVFFGRCGVLRCLCNASTADSMRVWMEGAVAVDPLSTLADLAGRDPAFQCIATLNPKPCRSSISLHAVLHAACHVQMHSAKTSGSYCHSRSRLQLAGQFVTSPSARTSMSTNRAEVPRIVHGQTRACLRALAGISIPPLGSLQLPFSRIFASTVPGWTYSDFCIRLSPK